jgi:uncharacterized protein YjiS (DUF1127 family)
MRSEDLVATGRQWRFLPVLPVAKTIAVTVGVWFTRARTRRALADLDDTILRDIGISRWEAEHEAHKPFWRA